MEGRIEVTGDDVEDKQILNYWAKYGKKKEG